MDPTDRAIKGFYCICYFILFIQFILKVSSSIKESLVWLTCLSQIFVLLIISDYILINHCVSVCMICIYILSGVKNLRLVENFMIFIHELLVH